MGEKLSKANLVEIGATHDYRVPGGDILWRAGYRMLKEDGTYFGDPIVRTGGTPGEARTKALAGVVSARVKAGKAGRLPSEPREAA